MLRYARICLLVAVLAVGCGDAQSADLDADGVDLDDAREFDDYTLYYLGDSFQGLPLTFAGLGPGSGTGVTRAWSFIYGDCTPSGNDGGCAPPLEIQNWSICARFPALYPGPTPRTSRMHGADTLPAGGGLDVYTGDTTVVIFGRARSAALEALSRVKDDVPPEELPPPMAGSLDGKLDCQAEPLHQVSD